MALQQHGIFDFSIGQGAMGEPLWPPSLYGSISHTQEHAVAVCIKSDSGDCIGVDIESITKATRIMSISRVIFSLSESARVAQMPTSLSHEELVTLLFSCKESLIKAAYAAGHVILRFHDIATVDLDSDGQVLLELVAKPARDVLGTRFTAYYVFPPECQGSVLTTVRMPLISPRRQRPGSVPNVGFVSER